MDTLDLELKIVPKGYDQTILIVEDRIGNHKFAYRETELCGDDFKHVISDFMCGLYFDPVRVVAVNTLQNWTQDLSGEIAREIQRHCIEAGKDIPDYLQEFMVAHSIDRDCNKKAA